VSEAPALPVIRLEKIGQIDNGFDPTIEGAAFYEITLPDGRVTCMIQPFDRAARNADRKDKRLVWNAEGEWDALTLTPSFLCRDPGHGLLVHLFLTAGRIVLVGDSTVRLAEQED